MSVGLIIGAYLLVAAVITAVMGFLGVEEDAELIIVFWPIVLIVFVCIAPFFAIYWGAGAIRERFEQ